MARESSQPLPLDLQLQGLSRLSDRIRIALHTQDQSQPEEVLDDLAQLAGSLSRISRSVAKREDERQELLSLAEISQVVNSTLKLDDVLRIVMDTIVRLTGAERGFLMLRDERNELTIRIARNWEQETLEAAETEISRTVVNQVITAGQPVLTTNAQQDPRFDSQESVITLNLRSILCVPLKVREELIGVIYADNRVRTGLFTETERNLLAAFANHAAVAIENARLFESVRKTLAEVTGLKNLMGDVFASIASGVITTDLEGRITLTNRAAESILDMDSQSARGRIIDAIPLFAGTHLTKYLVSLRQTNRPLVGQEIRALHPEKGALDLNFNLSFLRDEQGIPHGIAIVLEDLTETRRLEAQRRLFARMVSPLVIEQFNPDQLQLGGERNQITTLFADLRGFTSLAEQIDPEILVSVLNRYLGVAAEAILVEEGTIDKFMGDAIMAFFNAPLAQTDHTLRAVRAAQRMRAATQACQEGLPPELQLSFGIGIHFGEALLGLVGTEQRLEYTAIGDSVNTAKRLQENASAGQILLSAQAYNQVCQLIDAHPVGPIQVKGKKEPVQVYEVIGLV
jgi:PAS domain S-box-containing protein